jgi:nucleoside-triphosphatase
VREAGKPAAGFTTEELRERGKRVGFAIESLDGERATLAHVELPGPPRVGRYGVDLEAFEEIALPALDVPENGVVLIDEMGKMELASERFRGSVETLLEQPVPLVATRTRGPPSLHDRLKRRGDVELIRLTAKNRDALPAELARRVSGPPSGGPATGWTPSG